MVADLGVAAARVRAPPAVQYERRGRGEGDWVEETEFGDEPELERRQRR
jgi:hypothetical protein